MKFFRLKTNSSWVYIECNKPPIFLVSRYGQPKQMHFGVFKGAVAINFRQAEFQIAFPAYFKSEKFQITFKEFLEEYFKYENQQNCTYVKF